MAAIPCTTCLLIDCVNPPDVTLYNFQNNAFYSPGYTFVVSCPVGFDCQPGIFPITVTIPPGTFVITLPDPTDPNPNPLVVQSCTGPLSLTIPPSSTPAQINALAVQLSQQAAAAQAQCNAIANSPSPHGTVPPPQPMQFLNNAVCVPTLTCTPPLMFSFTGVLPPGFSFDGSNNLCMAVGMVSGSTQANADASATSTAASIAAGFISSGAISCVAGFNWNNMVWTGPTFSTFAGGTASGTSVGSVFTGAVTAPFNGEGGVVYNGSMMYNGPAVNANLHIVVTNYNEDTFGQVPSFVITLDNSLVLILNIEVGPTVTPYPGPGTYDIPFTVPDTMGMTLPIEVNSMRINGNNINVGFISMTIAGTLTPAF